MLGAAHQAGDLGVATTTIAVQSGSELKAVLIAVVSSICVGMVPFMARELQTSGVDTISLLCLRCGVGVCVLVPLAAMRGQFPGPVSRRNALALYGGGLFAAFQSFCYYKSMETVATSIAGTIFFAYPIFTLFIDRFVLGQIVPRSTVIAVLMIFLGVVLASLPSLHGAKAGGFGLFLVALTPLLYATYITVTYGFTRSVPTFTAAYLIYLGQLTAFGSAALMSGLKLPETATGWLAVLAMGTIGGSLQVASFAYALPRLSSSGYAVVVSLELVTVVMLGVALLGEHLTAAQVAGIALVLSGVLLDRLLRAWTRRTTPLRR